MSEREDQAMLLLAYIRDIDGPTYLEKFRSWRRRLGLDDTPWLDRLIDKPLGIFNQDEVMFPPSDLAGEEHEFPCTPGPVFVEGGVIYAAVNSAPLAKMVRDEKATKAGISPAARDANARRFAYCWNKVLDIEKEEQDKE